MTIRSATKDDTKHWSRMRDSLWPDSIATNSLEIEKYFSSTSNDIKKCFLIEDNGNPVGFIELNIRNYAEGSASAKVPYVEGWYIDEIYRGKGLGKLLMAQAEVWVKANGYSELASDAEIENTISISAHKKLGFKEIDRIVCFLKKLN